MDQPAVSPREDCGLYKPYNFVDGVRCSLYVSGRLLPVKGVITLPRKNFNYGIPYNEWTSATNLSRMWVLYCQVVTLLRGEPFLNTGVWPFSVKSSWSVRAHHRCVVVDRKYLGRTDAETEWCLNYSASDWYFSRGRFELAKRDLTLQFRGSSNQRIIECVSCSRGSCFMERPLGIETIKFLTNSHYFDKMKEWNAKGDDNGDYRTWNGCSGTVTIENRDRTEKLFAKVLTQQS